MSSNQASTVVPTKRLGQLSQRSITVLRCFCFGGYAPYLRKVRQAPWRSPPLYLGLSDLCTHLLLGTLGDRQTGLHPSPKLSGTVFVMLYINLLPACLQSALLLELLSWGQPPSDRLLTLMQSDSFGAPFSKGIASDNKRYSTQCSETYRSSLPDRNSALGTSALSMSDYGKSQNYVYGKWYSLI